MNLAFSIRANLLFLLSAGLWVAHASVIRAQDTGFKITAVEPGLTHKAGFTLMSPADTAILFTNTLSGDAFLTNAVAHNGSGVAIGDVDGDGWQDIYLCNLEGPNRLYRNFGNWRFQEMDLGPAACSGQLSTGAVFADVDGDGDLDLLVNGIAAGTRLFLNDGKGHWTEVTDSGLSRTASATSLALADIDGDGDLDLYCTHYIDVMHLADPSTRFAIGRRDGKLVVTKINDQPTTMPKWRDRFEALPDGSVRELPEVDGLYRNDGHGHFTAIQFEPGEFLDEAGNPIAPYRDWGLGVMFRDINGDGAPDMYVCNDNASPDRFWINNGKGAFRAIQPMALRHTSRSSMGVDFADINRDGHDDFIVLDMLAREHEKRMTQLVKSHLDAASLESIDFQPRYNRNALFIGRPDGTFAETALMAGVAATDWSWCPVFIDVDLDGYEDLLITNGFEQDVLDQDSADRFRHQRLKADQLKRYRQFYPSWHTANASFRNRGDGTFAAMYDGWGFDQKGVSHGMALGDLDNDGDMDVVVNNLNAAAGVYRNDGTAPRVGVRLKGTAPNTAGIGARVRLLGGAVPQSQEIICGGRYLSGDQAMRVFAALTNPGAALRLEVVWRNGSQDIVSNVQPNHIYEINQSENPAAISKATETVPIFSEISTLLNHSHTEAPFDDSTRQALLPARLSRLGPGISWYDLNGDGWEDLIIASGRSDKAAIFLNDSGKKFRRVEPAEASQGDQGAVVGWADGIGNRVLLAATSNFELASGQQSEITVYNEKGGTRSFAIGTNSPGPLVEADLDGDGDLDILVGERFNPGRYPEPVSATVWLNEKGTLQFSLPLSEPFQSVGMVSGAAACDLDGDGKPEIILAIHWGPIRVFHNENGHFQEKTAEWGLAAHTGLWTSVTVGDFDGDGKMDLAVGNRGRNSVYELKGPGPLRVYFGDWRKDGNLGLMEAWQSEGKWFPIRNRFWFATALPELQQRFPTHQEYSKATIQDILGANFSTSKMLEAARLESGVFLNRGSHFIWVPFPQEAQISPIFSMNVGDFDGDGIEDIFVSQNYFGMDSDLSRDDSGRGLWLRGNGDGTFKPQDGASTGIKIYGEQRGAALADFDHDGRIDLAVTQNNSTTKLYRNIGGRRGLRVLLTGLPGNPDCIGTQMRIVYGNGALGPCRSVQAGSGYWSQDGAIQVLGLAPNPKSLWIQWPGGRTQTVPLEKNAWDLHVNITNESK
jgi:hypothetical protein